MGSWKKRTWWYMFENWWKKLKETSLYNENSYETLLNLRNSSRYLFSRNGDERTTIIDNDNGITYEISRASDHFVFFILNQIKELETPSFIKHNINFRFRRFNETENNFLKKLNASTGFLTLEINPIEKTKIKTYENLASSFLFTLSYNLGTSIIELKSIDEFSMPERH